MSNYRFSFLLLGGLSLAGCSSLPPEQPQNICKIFEEKPDWHDAALDVRERWGVPVHIPMAIMYQESSFKYDAAPPMEYFLGFIPIGRASDAYGYSQAKTPVWGEYVADAGSTFADRDDFDDAIDFVGWYMNRSSKINKVSKWDAYAQYLNYHEGHGGYRRASYEKKPWLKKVAKKVEARAKKYSEQYWSCKDDLNSGWF
ncbi:hypothetical protein A3752_08100 [Oleiphilus sp. HI0081]|uniref:transglycosylase SLT domain-containing protein n=2 Tax=Oleiphilus TaxID=141450 RepID=UPI0007C27192|nr:MULTISPECIES: hypothetical protein [unclassified Oleiphilus]KZY44115.1 hypothetical protein A3732_01740 [Oleiphilus sp. HI0050]KZY73283.1 hypothetical protein A3740_03530 [Oleiphilus sp. HI0068]KZY76990.1 hypothetical protein A3741_10230 [Oleiphilus sp. HI0069]KZY89668.1 hypothetical protein A3743_07875 [Oleiphilus sp. HI0072]KZZ17679.1 hypothetical protein A3749_22485 [Oleiphilus sp. HI0078]KZZ21789.1 hypothetical protein A3752_08100 [Oleiphilus sp. HI0081]